MTKERAEGRAALHAFPIWRCLPPRRAIGGVRGRRASSGGTMGEAGKKKRTEALRKNSRRLNAKTTCSSHHHSPPAQGRGMVLSKRCRDLEHPSLCLSPTTDKSSTCVSQLRPQEGKASVSCTKDVPNAQHGSLLFSFFFLLRSLSMSFFACRS